MLSSSSHGNSSQLVSVHSSCPLLLSLFPLPPAPALSSCLIALRAPMPRFRTKVPDLALRFSTFWPQMNSPVLSFPILSTLCSMHDFLFPSSLIYLISPYPKTIIFSNLKDFHSLTPNIVAFWDHSKATHFYDVSFNSKYLLIIFVQDTILGIWERRINRRVTVPALTKLQKNNNNNITQVMMIIFFLTVTHKDQNPASEPRKVVISTTHLTSNCKLLCAFWNHSLSIERHVCLVKEDASLLDARRKLMRRQVSACPTKIWPYAKGWFQELHRGTLRIPHSFKVQKTPALFF